MKEKIKRHFSWFLALVILCGLLPFNAMAATTGESPKKSVVQSQTAVCINPLYTDVVTEADLVEPVQESAVNPADVSGSDYAVTYEEAGAQMREGMKLRETTVTAYYQSENYDFNTAYQEIFAAAVAHTGDPKEGDSLLWVYAGYRVSASGYSSGGVYYMTLTYTMTYYTTAEQEAELDAAVNALLSQVDTNASDYEKLCTVYDYICANITYDYDNLQDDTYKLKYTAYAALVNKTAVCQGYAALLYRLALELGIDCRFIGGTGNGGGHGWNIVKLNNLYYDVDATWDAIYLQQVGYYKYFLQCEQTFTEGGTDHIRDAEYDTESFHAAYPMAETDYDPYAETEEPSVTYTSVSISLEGDIGLNYYVKLSEDLAADEGTYMQFTFAEFTQTVTVSQALQSEGGIYRFSCAVPAKRMTDTITGQMYTSDGTAVGEAKAYSVKQYCDALEKQLENSTGNDALKNLLNAMLNYGAYSQLSLNYNTDQLANADMDEADKLLPETLDASAYAHSIEGSEAGIQVYSASLLLESKTTIRFYFKLTGEKEIGEYTFLVDGTATEPMLHESGAYYIDVPNIAAKELDVAHTVSVGGLSVNYSGLSYVNQVLNWDAATQAGINVVKALYVYNQAANAYFDA